MGLFSRSERVAYTPEQEILATRDKMRYMATAEQRRGLLAHIARIRHASNTKLRIVALALALYGGGHINTAYSADSNTSPKIEQLNNNQNQEPGDEQSAQLEQLLYGEVGSWPTPTIIHNESHDTDDEYVANGDELQFKIAIQEDSATFDITGMSQKVLNNGQAKYILFYLTEEDYQNGNAISLPVGKNNTVSISKNNHPELLLPLKKGCYTITVVGFEGGSVYQYAATDAKADYSRQYDQSNITSEPPIEPANTATSEPAQPTPIVPTATQTPEPTSTPEATDTSTPPIPEATPTVTAEINTTDVGGAVATEAAETSTPTPITTETAAPVTPDNTEPGVTTVTEKQHHDRPESLAVAGAGLIALAAAAALAASRKKESSETTQQTTAAASSSPPPEVTPEPAPTPEALNYAPAEGINAEFDQYLQQNYHIFATPGLSEQGIRNKALIGYILLRLEQPSIHAEAPAAENTESATSTDAPQPTQPDNQPEPSQQPSSAEVSTDTESNKAKSSEAERLQQLFDANPEFREYYADHVADLFDPHISRSDMIDRLYQDFKQQQNRGGNRRSGDHPKPPTPNQESPSYQAKPPEDLPQARQTAEVQPLTASDQAFINVISTLDNLPTAQVRMHYASLIDTSDLRQLETSWPHLSIQQRKILLSHIAQHVPIFGPEIPSDTRPNSSETAPSGPQTGPTRDNSAPETRTTLNQAWLDDMEAKRQAKLHEIDAKRQQEIKDRLRLRTSEEIKNILDNDPYGPSTAGSEDTSTQSEAPPQPSTSSEQEKKTSFLPKLIQQDQARNEPATETQTRQAAPALTQGEITQTTQTAAAINRNAEKEFPQIQRWINDNKFKRIPSNIANNREVRSVVNTAIREVMQKWDSLNERQRRVFLHDINSGKFVHDRYPEHIKQMLQQQAEQQPDGRSAGSPGENTEISQNSPKTVLSEAISHEVPSEYIPGFQEFQITPQQRAIYNFFRGLEVLDVHAASELKSIVYQNNTDLTRNKAFKDMFDEELLWLEEYWQELTPNQKEWAARALYTGYLAQQIEKKLNLRKPGRNT